MLVIPGVYDPLGARLAQECGFQVVLAGGYAVSASLLGMPDMGLITLNEMLDTVRRIRSVTDLAIVADIDTGGGGSLNVRRTITQMELAGASGVQIEDQVFPKKAGLTAGRRVVEPEAMVTRLKAATDARRGDLVIIARTDAPDLTEAIDRANLYREYGADVLFIEDIHSRESMERVVREVRGPCLAVMVEGSGYPFLSAPELEKIGFKITYYCDSLIFATTFAARLTLEELRRTGTTKALWDRMTQFEEFNRLIGFKELDRLQAAYEMAEAEAVR
jgi:methylisocitrate lyase